MSEFSEKLSYYIAQSGCSVYQLAKEASLDRTTLQKTVKGQRLPSMDYIKDICKHIKISPKQEEELLHLYKIEKLGRGVVESWDEINEIFSDIQRLRDKKLSQNINSIHFDEQSLRSFNHKMVESYTSELEIVKAIMCMIEQEILEEDEPEIYMDVSWASEYVLSQLMQNDNLNGKSPVCHQLVKLRRMEAAVAPEAETALAKALGVYDLADGFKTFGITTLSSAPFDIAVSPEESRYAVVYAYEAAVYGMEDKTPLVTVPIENSALSDCAFIDEDTIVFAGKNGVEAYSIVQKKTLWQGEKATNIAVSENRQVIAAVDRDASRAKIYKAATGEKINECDFGKQHLAVPANDTYADPKDYIFTLNQEGSQLAVSFSDGGLTLFNIQKPEESLIIYDTSDFTTFSGDFCGNIFAFGAGSDSENFLGIIDTEKAEYVGSMDSEDPFEVQADKRGIYLANGNVLEKIDPETLEEKELAYTPDQVITHFAVTDRNSVVETDQGNVIFFDAGANQNTVTAFEQENDFVQLTSQYAVINVI